MIFIYFSAVYSLFFMWTGHVARLGKRREVCKILVGKPEEKRPLGRPRIDGRIIIIWIFRKWVVGV